MLPLFVLMMVTSMLALQYVTVGTFVVVRNLARSSRSPSRPRSTGPTTSAVTRRRPPISHRNRRMDVRGGEEAVTHRLLLLLANLAFACAERMLQRHLLLYSRLRQQAALMLLNNGIGAILASLALLVMAPKEWYYLRHSLRHKSGSGLAIFFSCVLGQHSGHRVMAPAPVRRPLWYWAR